jgi:hypothetical protein
MLVDMGADVDTALKYAELRLGAIKKRAPSIVARSLNRGISRMNTVGKKAVKDRYTIKAKKVNDSVKVWRANKNDLRAAVRVRSERIHVVDLKVSSKKFQHKKKTKKPVTVEIIKGQVKPIYGFMAPGTGSGKPILFRRSRDKPSKRIRIPGTTSKGRRKTNSERPIEAIRGPSVPEMMNHRSIRNEMADAGKEKFSEELEREINRALGVK